MIAITLADAMSRLDEWIDGLEPGEEILITRDQVPVARLRVESSPRRPPRQPGNCIGLITFVDDDDAHLADFAEYMG